MLFVESNDLMRVVKDTDDLLLIWVHCLVLPALYSSLLTSTISIECDSNYSCCVSFEHSSLTLKFTALLYSLESNATIIPWQFIIRIQKWIDFKRAPRILSSCRYFTHTKLVLPAHCAEVVEKRFGHECMIFSE